MRQYLFFALMAFSFAWGGGSTPPPCSDSDITTRMRWTNTVSCHFNRMAFNYQVLAIGISNRQRGQISIPLNEEDSGTKSEESSVGGGPIDPNSPIGQLVELRGSAVKGFAKLQPYFQKRVLKMAAAYLSKYGKKLIIQSAYRSPDHQARLFKRAVAKYGSYSAARKHVAPPGRSKHNVGLAVDVDMSGGQGNQLASSGIMRQNDCWRPMSYENWHIEPIETKATRQGARSPAVLDSNISRKVGDTTQGSDYNSRGLSQKYEALQLRSRYSQELTLMITEMLETRNYMSEKAELEQRAKELLDVEGDPFLDPRNVGKDRGYDKKIYGIPVE